MGYLPQAMVNYLALLGWGDGTENEFFTIADLGLFSIFFPVIFTEILFFVSHYYKKKTAILTVVLFLICSPEIHYKSCQ